MSGQVVHFEIPAENMDRAQAFYREAFGWQTASVPGMDYTLLGTAATGPDGTPTERGAINGGMLARRGPIAAPVVTIQVDDIDDALGAVERLGGQTVIGRQAVGDMGFTAYFTDTEGNLMGLWQTAV
jgi:predicted enzyme related to lactoylglutathione lyase